MAIDKVRAYLKQWDKDKDIREFDVSSATVELAAQALYCKPERIAKTISFKVNDSCVLIVAAGDAKIDNAKFKGLFKTKAKMLAPGEIEILVGHEIGGVCPFAVNDNVRIYLDISINRFDTVFPACGSSNSVIELTPDELEKYSNSLGWIDVCKGWQENQVEALNQLNSELAN
ncbi:MAG: YbaK/EbsC family protein [Desulfotomaculaceae bacterium]|nr:YbaK/EbsC family protein [Desulfotomaculaceae bacterium]MDD4766666.1 YbaK/EbsC family protein [Desulfotomaculaceae bacterium]